MKFRLSAVLMLSSFNVFALPACEKTDETTDLFKKAEQIESNDIEKSLTIYRQATDQGHANAAHRLGYIYVSGSRVNQDYQKAYFWFEKAAHLGQHNSMFSLGIMNKDGEGRAVNLPLAHAWYSLAGDYIPTHYDDWFIPRSKVRLYQNADDHLANSMTEEELVEAKKLKKLLHKKLICSWYSS